MKKKQSDILSTLQTDNFQKLQATQLLLINNMDELLYHQNWKALQWNTPITEPDTVQKIREELFELFGNWERTIALPQQEKDNILLKLVDYQKDLAYIHRCLHLYDYELDNLSEYLGSFIKKRDFLQEYGDKLHEWEQHFDPLVFTTDCLQLITNTMLSDEIEAQMYSKFLRRYLMVCFPVRMAKNKFLDYIRTGLTECLDYKSVEDIADQANKTIGLFHAKSLGYYGEYFVECKQAIEAIDYNRFDTLDSAAIDEQKDAMQRINDDLQRLTLYIETLFESTLYFTILLIFCNDWEQLIENNYIHKDLYYWMKENLVSTKDQLMEDSFRTRLEQEIGSIQDSFGINFDEYKIVIDSVKQSDLTEEAADTVRANEMINLLFYQNIEDISVIEIPYSEDPDLFRNQKIEEIISFIQTSLATESPKYQRFLKSNAMKLVPCTLYPKELEEYIRFNLDSFSDLGSKFMAVDDVYHMFDLFSSHEDSGEAPHHVPHHVHGEDCGCGHHHH